MLNIAFLVALDKPGELELHVTAALRNGVTPDEIMEVLIQSAVYCGFPAALSGTRIARQALERWEKGEGAKARTKRASATVTQAKVRR
jgi:4-carboxymuconolactone decarboxylase